MRKTIAYKVHVSINADGVVQEVQCECECYDFLFRGFIEKHLSFPDWSFWIYTKTPVNQNLSQSMK